MIPLHPTAESCHAAGYVALVEAYHRICADDSIKYDELKWAALSAVMDEALVLYGDPTRAIPLGVIDAPPN